MNDTQAPQEAWALAKTIGFLHCKDIKYERSQGRIEQFKTGRQTHISSSQKCASWIKWTSKPPNHVGANSSDVLNLLHASGSEHLHRDEPFKGGRQFTFSQTP